MADVPAEAVEAAARALADREGLEPTEWHDIVNAALAAALPHLRAKWEAEQRAKMPARVLGDAEAAAVAHVAGSGLGFNNHMTGVIRAALVAADPIIRADERHRVLAEADAALRDYPRWRAWARGRDWSAAQEAAGRPRAPHATAHDYADYLADVLGTGDETKEQGS